MKLQIKLSNNKCLVVEIEETRTVKDLKEKLLQYLDLPRNIIITYEGEILEDTKKLSEYNFDERKILNTIIPKKRKNTASVDRMMKELAKCESAAEASRNGELIELITGMGFSEDEVRRALAECCYNPKRAVEYILDNTPITPSSVDSEFYSDLDDDDTPLSYHDLFSDEPALKRLRHGIFDEPYSLNAAVERMTEEDPSMLEVIDENPEDFLDYFQNYEFEDENDSTLDINFEAIEDERDGQNEQDDNDKDEKDKDKQSDKNESDEAKNDNIEGGKK